VIPRGEGPEAPQPRRQTGRPLTVLGAVAIVAIVVGAAYLVAGDDPFDLWDSTPDACEVESSSESFDIAAARAVRQVLSPEPVLRWTPVSLPVEAGVETEIISSASTPPDGLVYILATEKDRVRLLATVDGVEWNELPLPADVHPEFFRRSDEHWVIAGPATDRGSDDGDDVSSGRFLEPLELPLDRVVVSDDGGESWAEVPVDPQNPPMWSDQHLPTLDLLVSGEQIALVTLVRPVMHLDEVLADRGLLQANEDAGVVGFEDGEVVVGIREAGSLRASDISGSARILRLPLDDLDLTERDLELVHRFDRINAAGLGYVRVYAGDRDGLKIEAEFDTEIVRGVASEDDFVLAVDRDEARGWRFLASADGRTWDEIYSAGSSLSLPLAGLGPDGRALAVVGHSRQAQTVLTLGCGQPPMPVAAFELPEPNGSWVSELVVSGGPAGLVAIQKSEKIECPDTEIAEQKGRPTETETIDEKRREGSASWSPDGDTWSMLDTQDAFGVDLASSTIRFAVGGDFVLARVKAREMNSAWYVAEVP